MVIQEIDNVKFRLKKPCDVTWIKKYGTVFSVIDATGSGCICFGVGNGKDRYFIKIAGVDTVDAEISPGESVETLKNAAELYQILKHQNLVELLEHYPVLDCYAAVFRWVEGECLFDHWNFEKYDKNPGETGPAGRFKKLSPGRKLSAAECLFSFLENVSVRHYVAVDFYDGSLIYDFAADKMMICDIDLFRKQPAYNDAGEAYWGTKRLKAPEEYRLGAVIDEATNVFTLGALMFEFFGKYTQEEIDRRYKDNQFLPCKIEYWSLGSASYSAVLRAVDFDREKRYLTISDFHKAFLEAIRADEKSLS